MIKKFSMLIVVIALSACDHEVEREIEVKIDEEKLGRAIGRHLVIESQKLITETIVRKELDLDMVLPFSANDQDADSTYVSLEINSDGRLYGTNDGERSLLANEVTESSLAQTREWLERLKTQRPNLLVSVKVSEEQPQQSVIELLNLFTELEITKVTFSSVSPK